ncbi:MAG: leucine-rich repeat protein [Clostridia bacterium]|nr:leucine-rich repeat protein [Clostridia bacterium]
MKKGKLKKIIAVTAMGICALAMPFSATGCFSTSEVDIRVKDGYIQWSDNGKTWENVIAIEELKGSSGSAGANGIDGREVEFQTTNTHIQWRYVTDDSSDTWKDLISLEEIEGKDGANGSNGENGIAPHIGQNGNWWVGTTDTGVRAKGVDGTNGNNGANGIDGREVEFQTTNTHIQWRYVTDDGSDTWKDLISLEEIEGKDGANGSNGKNGITPHVGQNGNWYIGTQDTGVKAEGENGDQYAIGEDGYWYLNGEKTEFKAIGQDASYSTYLITYEYDCEGMEEFFDNYKTSQEIDSNKWIQDMPKLKEGLGDFDWCVKGTDKVINNFDFLGNDVTLVMKWKQYIPGLYQSDKCVMLWDQIDKCYPLFISLHDNKLEVCPEELEGMLVIDPSVKSIKSYAFENNTKITDIIIPSNTRIGEGAFQSSNISSVVIGEGIKELSSRIFQNCKNLQNVVLPNSIETIGAYAFENCEKLTAIELSKSLKNIESGAFDGCISLKQIDIPEGVEILGGRAFADCSSLEIVNLPDSLNIILNGCFINCVNLLEIEIPIGCTLRGDVIFKNCTNLRTVKLPSDLIYIPEKTFMGCAKLQNIHLPEEIEVIEDYAFAGCKGLKYIKIPGSLISMGEYVFAESGLVELEISRGVKEIGKYAFSKTNLVGVVIPKSVTDINEGAFKDCSKLSYVEFMGVVDNIGEYAFANCSLSGELNICAKAIRSYSFENCSTEGLDLYIGKEVESIISSAFKGVLFNNINVDAENTVFFASGNCLYDDESVYIVGNKDSVIPSIEGVRHISEYALYGCVGLTTITIPKNITRMYSAFVCCEELMEIIYLGTEEEWLYIQATQKIQLPNDNVIIKFEPQITE